MLLKDALALVELLRDVLLELSVSAQAEALRAALHLHQVARYRARAEIEIEQGQVRPAQRDFVPDRLGLIPHRVEQIDVRVERHHDLVAQRTLGLQKQARQRQAESFRPGRRGGDQLERQTA